MCLPLGIPLMDALGRLRAAGSFPPVSGAGFFSSVTQAVSAADSLRPRTALSTRGCRLHAAGRGGGRFLSKGSCPAGCAAAKGAAAGSAPQPTALLCCRKGEEELSCLFFWGGVGGVCALLETDALGNGLIMSSSCQRGELSRIDGGTTKWFLSDTACDFHRMLPAPPRPHPQRVVGRRRREGTKVSLGG